MIYKFADENQKKISSKFPSSHFLGNPKNVENLLLWSTFFRRNLHRFAIDYLKVHLHLYQILILYLMGRSRFITIIAVRSAAKSWLIALYACCICILKPYTKVVISSATKRQSKLIVSEKIKNELMNKSVALRREISRIKDNESEVIVSFRNHSTIAIVPASENGRGYRSTCCIREEFRQIKKVIDDSVLSPFQIIRQAPYMVLEPYISMKDLQEDPVDIYIGSSWLDNGHWMWDIVDKTYKNMIHKDGHYLIALDESIVLKHNIKTKSQLVNERRKQDSLTWRIEYLNERVRENINAFFPYNILVQNQVVKNPFYPRRITDIKSKKRNPHEISKQNGEIRIVSCDMAFVEDEENDKSVFSCIRLLPEIITVSTEAVKNLEVKQGYRRIVSYMESASGGDTYRQAVRIRQLYEDFDADYIVLDSRHAGIAIYDLLAKVMYDEERDCEYSPLSCMNDESVANRIKVVGAKPVIFTVNASQKLNSDIAILMKNTLEEKKMDLLINRNEAVEEILMNIDDYRLSMDINTQLFYEQPFLETQMLINEMINLVYEKKEQTGVIVISEQAGNRKDRYTSVSYGNYFASLLEKDLLSDTSSYDYIFDYS